MEARGGGDRDAKKRWEGGWKTLAVAVREQEFGSICWTHPYADLHGLEKNERIEPHFSTMLPLAVCVSRERWVASLIVSRFITIHDSVCE